MSETSAPSDERVPTVYFIDDSATMREVIKIAFRRENINVVTCHDAASALEQFAETPPDAVISDVIMPDKDGYEVCQYVKQNPELRKTPVILMSGVVNRSVAEKAIAVQADELIRKPFQLPELVARVKNLLQPKGVAAKRGGAALTSSEASSQALASFFDSAAGPTALQTPSGVKQPAAAPPVAGTARPSGTNSGATSSAELQKLRSELARLEHLVRKLQTEVEAERRYCAALEAHIKALQEAD